MSSLKSSVFASLLSRQKKEAAAGEAKEKISISIYLF